MDGRAWNSGYEVSVDNWRSFQWVKSIREVTQIFNEHGIKLAIPKCTTFRYNAMIARRGASIRVLYGRYPNKHNLSRSASEASVTYDIL